MTQSPAKGKKKAAKKTVKKSVKKTSKKAVKKKTAPKAPKKKVKKKAARPKKPVTAAAVAAPPKPEPEAEAERRSEARNDCQINGRIVSRNNERGTACQIRDLSRHGARLKFLDTYQGPRLFTLITEHGERYNCALAWTLNTLVGVKFI